MANVCVSLPTVAIAHRELEALYEDAIEASSEEAASHDISESKPQKQ